MENSDKKTIESLVSEIGVTRPDLIRYSNCFNIDLKSFCKIQQDYIGLYLELYEEGYDYLLGKRDEIIEFSHDFFKYKTVEFLCEKLGLKLTEFVQFYNLHNQTIHSHGYTLWPKFKPSMVLTLESKVCYISTQLLIHLHTKFPPKKCNNHEPTDDKLAFENIIGYDDFKKTVIDQLSPIVDSKSLNLWGLRRPGGIILFGPPGCGKTFWAQQISEYLQFQFKELPRSQFASTFVDGAVKNLKDLLDNVEPKTVLLFDEFDSVAETRSSDTSGSRENIKLVNTLLQEIPKLIKKEVLILAATNYLSRIDAAVIRPGRFDLKIPIFPPNNKERAEIIYFNLKKNLNHQSPLVKIILNNNITSADYFLKYTNKMQLFSNSLLEDFVDTLKRSLKLSYESGMILDDIKIDDERIIEIVNVTKAKISREDNKFLINFYKEVISFSGSVIYQDRLNNLKIELDDIADKKQSTRKIGFVRQNK